MQPYFQEIIEQFKGYLAAGDDENLRKLQIQVLGKYIYLYNMCDTHVTTGLLLHICCVVN